MAIKYNLGKLTFKLPFEAFISEQLTVNDFDLIAIRVEHLNIVANLESHHRDPFDRLIIAQAIVKQIPIVGLDKAFDFYAVEKLW